MAPRRKGAVRSAVVLAALFAAVAFPWGRSERVQSPGPAAPIRARVLGVVDGDTVRVRMPDGAVESVRYIGVDTPESTPSGPLECFGREAAAENRRLVGGRSVVLEPGVERRDAYGRMLAWVTVRGVSVNARLLRMGFARTLAIAPNDGRAAAYARFERRAARAGRGLWGLC